MSTNRVIRVIPQTDATGRRLTFAERQALREEQDNERRKQERIDKQVAAERARLNPPPKPLPFKERQAQRDAEDQGRRDAEAKAQAEAASKLGPVNPYQARAQQLESQLYQGGSIRNRYNHMLKLADQWNREQAAMAEAAERQAAIDADEQVQTSRDYAASLLKTAPPEFLTEVGEINGIAQAGDSRLAWERIRDLEQRIWRQADEIAAAKRMNQKVTDQEFQEAANAALKAREAAEHSAKMADELKPNDEASE